MPVVFLIVACLLNIGLDLLFVISFNMKVVGVALATVIAQFVSAALCMIRLMRMKHVVTIHRQYLKPSMAYTWRLIRLGCPAAPARPIFSMAALVVQSLTNSFWYQCDCVLHRCYACGRLCHDAQLYIWYRHDHVYRTEYRSPAY